MTSEHDLHFIGGSFVALVKVVMIHQCKTTPYHIWANNTVEAFNMIIQCKLIKICLVNRDDWDEKIFVILGAYNTTFKTLNKHMSFNLVYVQETVMLL